MTTYNTGNPIGSTDPRDLYDNAQNLDEAVNSDDDTFQDRLGKSRLTWAGIVRSGSGDPAIAVDAAARAESAASRVELSAELIAQDAAQQAVSNVVIAVDDAVDRAADAADRADSAAGRAETALAEVEQALGLNAANIYINVAAGLAATEDTENFWVLPNEGDNLENLTLYTNNASEAVKLYELYSLETYMIEEGSNWEIDEL